MESLELKQNTPNRIHVQTKSLSRYKAKGITLRYDKAIRNPSIYIQTTILFTLGHKLPDPGLAMRLMNEIFSGLMTD